jgi:hypothetical protein
MYKRTSTYKAYPVKVHFVWAKHLEEAAEAVRRRVPKIDAVDDSASADAMCLHSHKRPNEAWIIMTLRPTMGALAHEAVHASNFLLRDLGITTTAANDEVLAYMVQWIVDEGCKPRRKP